MPIEAAWRAGSLCVVGNINRDIKTAPLLPGSHLFEDGETPVSSIIETIGGGGANSACAAASLGAQVTFLGKVGVDAVGEKLERALRAHGITAHLARAAAHPTGTSVALSFSDGHRHFLSYQPNNESLTLEDLDLRALPGHRHLFRADIWFSKAMLFGGNEQLFKVARAQGLAVSIDLNWDPQWGVASATEIQARKEAVRAVLPWVTVAHGNVRELNEFAGSGDLETTLKRLVAWGVESVVVHMGAQGAGFFHDGHLIVEPAVPARAQVNTTGTGDVLSVCMMLLHHELKMSTREKLRAANTIVSQFIEGQRQFIPAI